MKSPKQLKIVSCIFSGINFPAVSPIVLPKITARQLKIVPPAGKVLKISSMIEDISPLHFLVIIARDRIDAEIFTKELLR